MDKVTIVKAELLKRLVENRDKHRGIFEEAMDGYKAEVEKRLEAALTEIRAKRVPNFFAITQLPVPEDHTGDYDAVIDMLQMANEQNIEIEEDEFRTYVRDEWRWKQQFITTNTMYAASLQR